MKRLALVLLLCPSFLPFASGSAHGAAALPQDLFRAARAAIVTPLEWDGLWNSVDSTYTCTGTFQGTGASLDTICGGKECQPPGMTFALDCTGTADATTIDMTCTATVEVVPDCFASFTVVTRGTRTGDTAFTVSTVSTTYSGTALGCDLMPPSCTQRNSHATRIGSAPADYCLTPAKRARWSDLKLLYR